MVRRYCRGVHGRRGERACPACEALLEYARQRRERCPHGETDKPFCLNCPIHCDKPEMRQQMRAVMRYAGPRMLLEPPHTGAAPYSGNPAKERKTLMPDKQLLCLLGEDKRYIYRAVLWMLRALCATSALRPACAMGFSCSLSMQGCPGASFRFGSGMRGGGAFLPLPAPRRCGTGSAQREEKPAGTSCTQSLRSLVCGRRKP